MAACSSSEQDPLVLRKTYDKLVTLADELDEKKKKKYSKRSSGEKCEKSGQRQENEELENDADGDESTEKRHRKSSAKKKRDGSDKKEQKDDGKKHKKSSSISKEEQNLESVSSDSKIAKSPVAEEVIHEKTQTAERAEHDMERRAHTGDELAEKKDDGNKHKKKPSRPKGVQKDVSNSDVDKQNNALHTQTGEHDLEQRAHIGSKLKGKKDDGIKHKEKASRPKGVQKYVCRGVDKQNLVHENTQSTPEPEKCDLEPGAGNLKEKEDGRNEHKKKPSRSKEVTDKQTPGHENTYTAVLYLMKIISSQLPKGKRLLLKNLMMKLTLNRKHHH